MTTHKPYRHKLPEERAGITHKFNIGGHEGYITVGMYPDGKPGEVFITMSKEGSTVSGLMDGLAILISMALQYNVPLELLCEKFIHTKFEPSGYTGNEDLPHATSILDYLFQWLKLKFIDDAEAKDKFAAGRPLAEKEPPMADDKAEVEIDAVQHAEQISDVLAPLDPTKANGSGDLPKVEEVSEQ